MARWTIGVLALALIGCGLEDTGTAGTAEQASNPEELGKTDMTEEELKNSVMNEMLVIPAGDFIFGCNPAVDAWDSLMRRLDRRYGTSEESFTPAASAAGA